MRDTSLQTTKHPQRGRGGTTGRGFGILGPLPIFETGEDRYLKFGVWMEYVSSGSLTKNQRERGHGHVTDFEIWGPRM